MCGWLIAISADALQPDSLCSAIRLRGPDNFTRHNFTVQQSGEDAPLLDVLVCASVLHLRGPRIAKQPFLIYPQLNTNGSQSDDDNDIDDDIDDIEENQIDYVNDDWICWNGQIFAINGNPIDERDISDTRLLARMLRRGGNVDAEEQFEKRLCQVLSSIDDGPWAFLYHHASSRRIYFGRDRLGRRSLLWTTTVTPAGVDTRHSTPQSIDLTQPFIVGSVSNGPVECGTGLKWSEVPTEGLFCLDYGVAQLHCIPWIAAVGTDTCDKYSIPPAITTSYPVTINRETSGDGYDEISHKHQLNMQTFHEILSESVRRRLVTIPDAGESSTARLAILFSGGLDCTVLAALSHQYLPVGHPIDLLNVAFENTKSAHFKHAGDIFNVPDRITGRRSAVELQKLFPDRRWRLIEINVSMKEYLAYKQQILFTIHPSDTVMDLSIAAALYFAGRAVTSETKIDKPQSTARVLLSGLGADELFAGYSRHRSAFQRSWPDERQAYLDLAEELQMDLCRLPTRNLGRDDRILSSLGKEVRFPFLAEPVVRFAASLPVDWKCDLRPSVPRAVGEKLWLRRYAKDYLSLHGVAGEQKRAIQFGARSAKIENRRERGGDSIDKEE